MLPLHRYFIEGIIFFPGRFQIFIVPAQSFPFTQPGTNVISGLFLVRHLFLYEASERGLGDVWYGEQPPKAHSCGGYTLLYTHCAVMPSVDVSKEQGLLNAPKQASTNNQHTGIELSEGRFSKPHDPFQGIFLWKPFFKVFFLSLSDCFPPLGGAHYIMHSGCSRALNFMWLGCLKKKKILLL